MSDEEHPESVASLAAGVSKAVDAPTTQASASRPVKEAVRTLFIAMGCVLVGVAVIIGLTGWPYPWGPAPQPENVVLQRLVILKWIGLALCADIAIIVFAFSTPFVGRVEASAGGNSIKLDGK